MRLRVASVRERLGRRVKPKIYRREEWRRMMDAKDAFVTEVMAKLRLDVIGGDDGSG